MAYNPKTGKGLGRFYDANHRAFRAREWRGFRDTFYDFFRWLYLYGFMAVKLGCHPILMVKAMMRYRWMVSYLTAAHMVDRHTMGLRGKELRYDGKRVTEIADNRLYINCFKGSDGKIYSGRVYAHENQGWLYGIFEARIKLPKGKGTWPAFWMMPCNNDFGANPWPKCGEIDIMEEVGVNPNYTSSSLHTEKFNHVMGTQITKERLTAGAEDGFHVYRLEWTPDYIKTYVDGKELLNFNNDGKNDVGSWPFNKPFYVILNLAWGGDWGGMKGVDESALPVQMEVDYVRVFQKK